MKYLCKRIIFTALLLILGELAIASPAQIYTIYNKTNVPFITVEIKGICNKTYYMTGNPNQLILDYDSCFLSDYVSHDGNFVVTDTISGRQILNTQYKVKDMPQPLFGGGACMQVYDQVKQDWYNEKCAGRYWTKERTWFNIVVNESGIIDYYGV